MSPRVSAAAHSAQPSAVARCAHCGDDLLGAGLPGEVEEASGQPLRFCCAGCRTVHALLAGAEGGRYYELLELEKAKAPRGGVPGEYRKFLEALREGPAVKSLGNWNGGVHSLTLECSDMQCAACGWLMERVLGETEGVVDHHVDFIHGEMHLRYDSERTTLPDVLEHVAEYGYAFRPKVGGGERRPLDRDAWMRLAVAAACFMNAMAFAVGHYLGLGKGMEPEWRALLGGWAFAASLPAVFYAAVPFYKGAWRAVKSRSFTIDVTVTLGVWIAFLVSFASVLREGTANYSDSLSALVFFLLLGRYAVRRFEGGLVLRNRWHESLSPGTVKVLCADGARWESPDDVRPGDVVEVEPGGYLPFDGTAEEGEGQMDTAFLTGEDRPRPWKQGDFLFAGYRVLRAPLRLRVASPHRATRAASLRGALESMAARKRSRNRGRERVAFAFTASVIALAVFGFFLHLSSGWDTALKVSAAVFIVSCSCALALAIPISRGVGLLRAHRLGFHFRDQETLERLADTRSAIFDKTGTLTFTRRKVARWEWALEGGGGRRQGILDGVERLTRMSAHPVSTAIHESLAGGAGEIDGFEEVPHFGIYGTWRAAGESVRLCVCRHGAWDEPGGPFYALGLTPPPGTDASPAQESGVPQACVFADGELVARVWLGEELKPGVAALLRGLGAEGVPATLLSGDHPERVREFAERCGFGEFQGGLSPERKQVAAREFQARSGPALAVGDGFNDSLLFGESAVALAVQGSAGPMAEEADAFMTSSRPEAILGLLRIARGTRKALFNCYVVSALYNAGAVSFAVAGYVTPLFAAVLMPIASLSLCLTAWVTVPKAVNSGQ